LPAEDVRNSKNEIYSWSDGSSVESKYAGAGVIYVNGQEWGLEDRSEIVPVKTNQYAEL
jgi:hypothetical protein